jgi:hypothetical protein
VAVTDTRQIVTTGTVSLTADDPLRAADRAAGVVEAAGGRVDGRTETAPTEGKAGNATLVLRIPAAKLTATLDAVKKLGQVVSVEIAASDVTAQAVDLDAHITALSASVNRLVVLLSTATDTKVLIDLETAISSRQGDLESLQSQQRLLTDQVTMSAITLDVESPANAPAPAASTFWGALTAGFAGFAAFFTGLFLVVGYLVPWLLLAAIAALVAVVVLRRHRGAAAVTTGAAAASPTGTPTAI